MSGKKWYGDGIYSRTRQRKNGKPLEVFYGRVWFPTLRRFRYFKLGTTPNQAETKMRRILGNPEAALAEREKKHIVVPTFGKALDRFLQEYRSRGGTDYYSAVTKAPREFFGERPLTDVTSVALDGYIKERRSLMRQRDGQRRVSESTIRKEVIALGTFFKWAKRKDYVHANPADAESLPRPKDEFDPQSIRWLTDDELIALRAASAPWLRNVIGWATETGMDKGKVRRLRWQELDLDRVDGRIEGGRFAMQRDKTGKPIRQVLSDGALEALTRAGKQRHSSGIVFLDADGQPIEEKALDWALGCAYKAAGITDANFRTFRHTFATRALRRGIPREVVAKMMGHSTAFITDRYMHVADDQLRAAAKALSGPERLGANNEVSHDRGRIPPAPDVQPPGVAPSVAGELGDEVSTAQVLAGQARRGAGVAEQGCLLSSYPG